MQKESDLSNPWLGIFSVMIKVKGKGTLGFSPDTTLCVHPDVS